MSCSPAKHTTGNKLIPPVLAGTPKVLREKVADNNFMELVHLKWATSKVSRYKRSRLFLIKRLKFKTVAHNIVKG